ncbi:MAG: hypothetical protein RLZZ369_2448 [Pseudomonadota bacterium]
MTLSHTPHLDGVDLRLLNLLQHDASLSNQALADAAHLSAATCHRRVKRLWDEGFIERQVAILSPQKMADALGWGLSALVEISLDVQTQEALDAFENRWQNVFLRMTPRFATCGHSFPSSGPSFSQPCPYRAALRSADHPGASSKADHPADDEQHDDG